MRSPRSEEENSASQCFNYLHLLLLEDNFALWKKAEKLFRLSLSEDPQDFLNIRKGEIDLCVSVFESAPLSHLDISVVSVLFGDCARRLSISVDEAGKRFERCWGWP